MKICSFTVTAANGLHARPCAHISSAIRNFQSEVILEFNGQNYNASNPISLMSANIACNDTITFRISGEDEEQTAIMIENILKEEV